MDDTPNQEHCFFRSMVTQNKSSTFVHRDPEVIIFSVIFLLMEHFVSVF